MTQSWPECHRELRVSVDRRWGPPEPLRGRSCQILTKWKEKPEKRLIRGEGHLGPRERWRRLVPTEPFSSQRGQALPISGSR